MSNSPIIYGPQGATSLVPGGVTLPGSTSGTLQIQPAAVTTTHTLTMPAANAAGVLSNNGSGALTWSAAASGSPPTRTIITAQIYTFAVTSFTASAGATYTIGVGNYNRKYTVVTSVTAASSVVMSSDSPGTAASGVYSLTLNSGVGDGLCNVTSLISQGGTYTVPAGVRYLRVQGVGAGGGSGSSSLASSPGGNGTAGSNTFFKNVTLSLVAGGGGAGKNGSTGTGPVVGGGFTFAAATTPLGLSGGYGSGTAYFGGNGTAAAGSVAGGAGGNSFFGGGGGGGGSVVVMPTDPLGAAGVINTGGGGGGAGNYQGAITADALYAGSGGGAGGYFDAYVTSLTSTYTYSLGTGGIGGLAPTAGGYSGSNGGTGILIIDEFY